MIVIPDQDERVRELWEALVDDPVAMAQELRGRQPSWLRRREELLEQGHPAWLGVRDAEDARITLRILVGR